MTQVLHILRKDLRHQRIDLVLYILLLILLGWLMPSQWPGLFTDPTRQFILSLLQVAIPIFWLVLITRLVHEEAIAGDRQFWTTRPYRWSSLLTAKLLFVALCIALPFVLVQCALVMQAGLPIIQPAQIVTVAKIALLAWVPMMLIAAVTSTLASSIFTLLGIGIAWLVFMATSLSRNARLMQAPSTHLVLGVLYALFFALMLAQLYKKRTVRQSRILLIASAAFFLVALGVILRPLPHMPGILLVESHYPMDAAPELHLNYTAAAPHTAKRDENAYPELRTVTLPIKLDGLPGDAQLEAPAVQFNVEYEGYRYTSPWRPVTLSNDGLQLYIPSSAMVHAGHVNSRISITLAAEEIQPDPPQTTQIEDRFRIPGGGACEATNPPDEARSPETVIVCHFAFGVAHRIEIQPNMESGCPVTAGPTQRIPPYEAGASLDPMSHWPVNFAMARSNLPPGVKRCMVQSLTTTVFHTARRFRTSIDIPAIRLADNIDR